MIFLAGGVGLLFFFLFDWRNQLAWYFCSRGALVNGQFDMMPLDLTFCDLLSNITHVYFLFFPFPICAASRRSINYETSLFI
jgi:hypothetical protein